MSDITTSAEHPDDIETVRVGWFKFRERRGAPWQPLRVFRDSGRWIVLLNGETVPHSGAELAKDIPFLLWRAPFHPITQAEYDRLCREYARAGQGSPLLRPGDPVDLRGAPVEAIYGGKR